MHHTHNKIDIPCTYFQTGNCLKGDQCDFQHVFVPNRQGAPARRPSLSVRSTTDAPPCRNFIQHGFCAYGDACRYQHPVRAPSGKSSPSVRITTNVPTKKNKPCRNFIQHGFCAYGDACRYQHPVGSHQKNKSVRMAHLMATNTSTAVLAPLPPVQEVAASQPPALRDVLKYVASHQLDARQATTHTYKSYMYRLDETGISLLATPEGDTKAPRSRIRLAKETAIHCFSEGILPYDPRRMYDASSDKLYVRYALDLTPLATPLEVCIPGEQGATRFRFQGSTVLLFKTYEDGGLDKEYYRAVAVYRWNSAEQRYKHCFQWSLPDFHVTAATSNFEYLVVARLPYSYMQLKTEKIMQDNNRAHREELIRLRASLEQEKQRALEEQRRRELAVQQQRQAAEEERRRKDPVDIYVWDEATESYTRVLVYSKPADDVQLLGKNLYLRVDGFDHEFELNMRGSDLRRFDLTQPLHVDRLCEAF